MYMMDYNSDPFSLNAMTINHRSIIINESLYTLIPIIISILAVTVITHTPTYNSLNYEKIITLNLLP